MIEVCECTVTATCRRSRCLPCLRRIAETTTWFRENQPISAATTEIEIGQPVVVDVTEQDGPRRTSRQRRQRVIWLRNERSVRLTCKKKRRQIKRTLFDERPRDQDVETSVGIQIAYNRMLFEILRPLRGVTLGPANREFFRCFENRPRRRLPIGGRERLGKWCQAK